MIRSAKKWLTLVAVGLIGGLFYIFFWYVLVWAAGNPLLSEHRSKDFFFYVALIACSLYVFRFRLNRGEMRFWQGLLVGLFVSSLTLGLSAGFVWYYLTYVHPEHLQAFINQFVQLLESNPEKAQQSYGAQWGQVVNDLKKLTAWQLVLKEELLKKIVVCGLITLTGSALLRK